MFVLGAQTWECDLDFSINVPVTIVGETSVVISIPGSSFGSFAINKFEGSGTNIQFEVVCTSPESGRSISGRSNSFILFPGSSTSSVGLLRKTSLALQYSGPYQVVQDIVDSFNTELGILQCEGSSCPPEDSGSRRGRKRSSGLNNWDMCSSPTCVKQDTTCSC